MLFKNKLQKTVSLFYCLLLINVCPLKSMQQEVSLELHHAVAEASIERVMSLLDAGIDIMEKDDLGGTALHSAANTGQVVIAQYLLDNGAEINDTNKFGNTPLHIAALKGDVACCKLFLDRGADKALLNGKGKSVLELAQKNRNPALVAILSNSSGQTFSPSGVIGCHNAYSQRSFTPTPVSSVFNQEQKATAPPLESVYDLPPGALLKVETAPHFPAVHSENEKIIDADFKCKLVVHWEGEEVAMLRVSPNRKRVVTGSANGSIHICDFETGTQIAVGGGPSALNSMVITPDSTHVITGHQTTKWSILHYGPGTICVWDIENGKLLSSFEVHGKGRAMKVRDLCIAPDGNTLFASHGSSVFALDSKNGKIINKFKLPGSSSNAHVYALCLSTDGSKLFVGFHTTDGWFSFVKVGQVAAFDTKKCKILWELPGRHVPTRDSEHSLKLFSEDQDPFFLQCARDNKKVVLFYSSNIAQLLDIDTGGHLGTCGKEGISAGCITLDNKHLISAGDKMKIWDLSTGWLVSECHEDSQCKLMQITSDGKRIVTAFGNTVRVWK